MTIREANVIIDVFRNELRTDEYIQTDDKRKLDAFKPLFEDGTATEEDRKKAQDIEYRIKERQHKMATLIEAVNVIENREFSITL